MSEDTKKALSWELKRWQDYIYLHLAVYMTKNIKARSWLVVVYPESAPENWIEILEQTGLQFAVSPLHDRDVNVTGEIKKAHWHVILSWENPTTYLNVKNIAEQLNAPIPIKCESVVGAIRYFTHQDNPDKYQYNKADIQVFNGFDVRNYEKLTITERSKRFDDILVFIKENNVVEYVDLLWLLRDYDDELYQVAQNNTIHFATVIRSQRHSNQPKNKNE